MSDAIPVFVLGASGLLAGEALRLLEGHPRLTLAAAASRRAGAALRELHPQLASEQRAVDEAALAAGIAAALANGPAGLLMGLPHGEAAPAWHRLRAALGPAAARLAVVDLSADFRLRATAGGEWTYGLPEFDRAALRAGARRAAAPGCFATAMQLAALPAADAGLLDFAAPWVMHAVTGSTGSGAAPAAQTHHPHRDGNLRAYALDGHRHEAELAQRFAAAPPRLHFLPHSGPFRRGIHLSAALPLAPGALTGADDAARSAAARDIYARRFAGEPFVRVLAAGAPELRHVAGSNRADLAVFARDGVLAVLLVLDNTLKGGAGQALQCLNLLLGLPEDAGLPRAGLGW